MARLHGVAILLMVLVGVLSIPKEGHVSGSFSAAYGCQDYWVDFDNQRHKIYMPDTDVDSLYREFSRNFLGTIAEKHADIEVLLKASRSKTMPLAPMNLAWPELTLLEPSEISHVSPSSYPLILSLPIQIPEDNGLYHFKVALTAPAGAKDLKKFQSQLNAIFLNSTDSDEQTGESIDLDSYRYPHATRQNGNYALYAGVLFRTPQTAEEYYARQLAGMLDRVMPVVESAIQDETYAKEAKALLDISKATHEKELEAGWFNPWGPIQDHRGGVTYFRPRWQTENVIVTVLLAFKKEPANELTQAVNRALTETVAPGAGQSRSLYTDLMILQLDNPERQPGQNFVSEKIDKPRMEQALTKVLRDKKKSADAKNSAVAQLETMVGTHTAPETVEAVAAHYRAGKPDYSNHMQALRVLRKAGTLAAAQALLDLYSQASSSDSGDAYFLRQEMLSGLEHMGTVAQAPVEKALATPKNQRDEKRRQELKAVLESIQRQ